MKCIICQKEFTSKTKVQVCCGSTSCWSSNSKLNGTPYKNEKLLNINRSIVFEKNNNKCSMCGEDAKYVHHIDRKRDNHSIENLTPVCASCHCKIHKGGFGRPRKYNIQYNEAAKRIGVSYPTLLKFLYNRDVLKESTKKKISDFLVVKTNLTKKK